MTDGPAKRDGQGNEVHAGEADEKGELIGRQLKQVYDRVVEEPIPERFLDLLKQIDDRQNRTRSS